MHALSPSWVWHKLLHKNRQVDIIAAFVIYEYAITLGQEIEMFWKKKFTGATALFLLNRYLLMIDFTFNIGTIERSSEPVSILCNITMLFSLTYTRLCFQA